MEGIVTGYDMARTLRQRYGGTVFPHVTYTEITCYEVIEFTEVKGLVNILPMDDTVFVVLILGQVTAELLGGDEVTAVDIENMGGTTGKDADKGGLTGASLGAVGGRDDVLYEIGDAVGLTFTVTPEHTSQAEEEVDETGVKFHLLLSRELFALMQEFLLMLPLLISKATEDT